MKKMILAVGGAAIALATAVAGNCAWRLYQEAKDEQVYLECTENYARIRHSGDVSSMYNGDGKLEVPVDFERLQKGNPDIYAWITIPGVVDAPVLQHATDDTYYQNHDAGGREEKSGAVFSESLNHMDFSDSLTVLYGANTEGSSQFEGLFRYRDRQFLEEHSIVYIFTPDSVLQYRIFAAYRSDNRHLLMRFNQGAHEGNVRAFIKDILSRREMNAAVDRGAEADTDDQFLTLSTHDYAGEEFRFLVQAYLQEKVT